MQHQFPHLWHCHTLGCVIFFSMGPRAPRNSITPRLPSKQQLATCLPGCPRWPHCSSFPCWVTYSHSAVLQTSHISVQVTLLSRGCSGRLSLWWQRTEPASQANGDGAVAAGTNWTQCFPVGLRAGNKQILIMAQPGMLLVALSKSYIPEVFKVSK